MIGMKQYDSYAVLHEMDDNGGDAVYLNKAKAAICSFTEAPVVIDF